MKTLFLVLALIPCSAFAERAVMENTAASNKTIYVNTSLQRVGISTTSPQYSLDVAGDARANYFRGNGSLLTGIVISTAGLQAQVDSIAVSTGVLTTGLANEISARQAADLVIGLTTGTLRSDLTTETNSRSSGDYNLGVDTTTLYNTKVAKSGDTMTGLLTMQQSSITLNGGSIMGANLIRLSNSFTQTTCSDGDMWWNLDDETVNVCMYGGLITLQLGQEMLFKARMEGFPGLNGSAVAITGSSGGRPVVELADADDPRLNHAIIGVLTEAAVVGNTAFFNSSGYVRDTDTDHLIEGEPFYVSTVKGETTAVPPPLPARVIKLGVCIRKSATVGTLFISVMDTPDDIRVSSLTVSGVTFPSLFNDITDPTGFVDRASVLSFANGTRTLSITGSHDVYYNGVKTTKASSSTVIPNVTGFYYAYYDSNGTLTSSLVSPGICSLLLGSVYWNATTQAGLVGDERHGIKMSCATHDYLHDTIGTRYATGLAGTFGNTTFSVAAGVIYDEDIEHSIPAASTATIIYKDGSADFKSLQAQTSYYIVDGSANLRYNSGNTLASVPANQYVAYWIFATNSPTQPIFSLMGQRVDVTLADARANNTYESLSFGTLPFKEMKVLYRVMLRNDVSPYEETQDLRSLSNVPSGTYVATSHSVLTDLGLSASNHPYDVSGGFASYNSMTAADALKVAKAGDTMTGQLTTSSSMTALGGFVGNLIGNAATVTNGAYLPSSQTFTGINTFTSSTTVNDLLRAERVYIYSGVNSDLYLESNSGISAIWFQDVLSPISPWRIQAQSNGPLSFIGVGGTHVFDNYGRVGINTASPAYQLDVTGGIRATSTMTSGGFYGPATGLTSIPSAQLSGTVPTALVNLSTVTTALASKENADTTIVKEADLTANDFNVAANVVSLDYTNGQAASAANKGFLTSADWSTFNGKQAAGSYITALTGNVTASGPGSVAATIVSVPQSAVNLSTVTTALSGKLSNTTTVPTSLVDLSTVTTALASKQPTGNYITSLTGAVTASGPGAAAATIVSVPQSAVNLSTVTTALSGKYDATGGNITGNVHIRNASGNIDLNVYRLNLRAALGQYNDYGHMDLYDNSDIAQVSLWASGNNNYIRNGLAIGSALPTAGLHVTGGITATSSVTASAFYGSGANLTDLPAGGVSVATETFHLGSGGDVFLASGTYIPIIGEFETITYTTITITGARCSTQYPSSVSATTFNIARSTDTGATSTYSYLFNTPISVAANEKYSAWAIPDQNTTYNPPYSLSLHIISIPASGTLPSEYDCEIRYWRRLD